MTGPGGLRKTRRIAVAGVAAGAAGALAGSVAVVSVADSETVLVWVQIVGVVATVAAAFLAFWTILSAKRQARESQDALIRERRIDFELGVLRDLAFKNLRGNLTGSAGSEFNVLAAMLPVDLVPMTRAAVGLPGTPDTEAWAEAHTRPHQVLREDQRKAIEDEILAAIAQRIQERG